MKITILQPSDPAGTLIGGIDTFIRGLLAYAAPDVEYELIGLTTDPIKRPVQRWTNIHIGSREVRFYPLFAMREGGRRPLVPASLRFVTHLFARRPEVHGDVLEFHTLWCALPYLRDCRPVACVVHNDMAVLRGRECDIRWRHFPGLYYWLERRIVARVDLIHCVNATAVTRYEEQMPSSRGRVHFTPTWADPALFHLASESERARLREEWRTRWGVNRQSTVLVSVGRMDAQKDPKLMMTAFAAVVGQRPNTRLVWIGDGVMLEELHSLAEKMGLSDKVLFTGLQPREEVARWLRGADLFLLSSVYEGMPMAVLEALASGVPVVTTDVGEVRRAVTDGQNGFVVTERTPRAFSWAVCTALEKLDDLRGQPCTEAVAQFNPRTVVEQIHRRYRRLLRERGGPGNQEL